MSDIDNLLWGQIVPWVSETFPAWFPVSMRKKKTSGTQGSQMVDYKANVSLIGCEGGR